MKKVFLLSLIFSLGIFFPTGRADATTISPLVLEPSVAPGGSTEVSLFLFNETADNLYLSGSLQPFQSKGEDGQVQLVNNSDISGQALSWVKLDVDSVVLKPGEKVAVPIKINVPKTASVGGYYLAAIWSTAPAPGKTSQVKITSQVGSLILLKVSGEAKEDLKITGFNLVKSKNIYGSLPINFDLKIQNDGNVHEKPTGMLEVKNVFGGVVATANFNVDGKNILPQSTRDFNVAWSQNIGQNKGLFSSLVGSVEHFKFGCFTAKINLDYGANHTRISSSEISFWIIPWKVLSVGLFIIILIIVVALMFRKKK